MLKTHNFIPALRKHLPGYNKNVIVRIEGFTSEVLWAWECDRSGLCTDRPPPPLGGEIPECRRNCQPPPDWYKTTRSLRIGQKRTCPGSSQGGNSPSAEDWKQGCPEVSRQAQSPLDQLPGRVQTRQHAGEKVMVVAWERWTQPTFLAVALLLRSCS